MAGPVTIGPPTEEDVQAYQNSQTFVNPTDPRLPSQQGAVTPTQAEIETTTRVLPSRMTGQGELSATAQALGMEEGDTSGFDMGLLGDFSRGFNDLILYLPDAAINAVAGSLEYAGVVEPGTVDRNFLSRVFNSSDYESQKVIIPHLLHYGTGRYAGLQPEEGKAAEYTRAAGQGTAMAVPFIGMQSRAAQATAAAPSALRATTAPSQLTTRELVAESMLNPYRVAPGSTAALEAGFGAVSAAGGEIGEDVGGETGRAIGSLSPLAPAVIYYGAKNLPGARLFRWTKDKIGGGIDEAQVRAGKKAPGEGERGQKAQGELNAEVQAAAATPEGQANVQRAIDIENRLNPYADEPITLSPAETTMDAPLLATQTRLETTGSPEFTRANSQRKLNAITAAIRFRDGELTGSPVDDAPLFIYDEATGQLNATMTRLDADGDSLTEAWAVATDPGTGVFPSVTDKAALGADIRSSIVANHQAAKDSAETLAKKLNINKADQLASRDATADTQQRVRDAVMVKQGEEAISYSGLPGQVKKFIEFEFKDGRMSFQDWKTFRDQVSSEIGKNMAVGNKTAVRQLAILAKELDNMGTAYGRTNEKFEEFRAWYDTNVILPYERSGVIKLTAKAPGGTADRPEYYLPDERVAATFLENSNTARQWMTLFGETPARMDNIKATVLDQIRNQAFVRSKGTFDPTKVDQYINKNRDVLTELGLIDDITNTQTLVDDLVGRQADLTARRRVISSNLLFKAIGRAQNTDSPEKLLNEALNSPALMRELKTAVVKDTDQLSATEAGEAFRAAVTQRLLAKAPDAMENPAKFKQWLSDNERVLDAAFDKSHVDNMYLIADLAERILATGMPKGTGVQQENLITRITNSLGTTPAGVSNRFIAVQEGRLGPRAAIGYVLSRSISAQSSARSDALFREMMFDPNLAKALATEAPESTAPLQISPAQKRVINTYLFNLGIDYGEDITGPGAEETVILTPNVPENPVTTQPPTPAPPPPLPPRSYTPLGVPQGSQPAPPAPTVTPTSTSGGITSLAPGQQKASASELFPFDPTLAAIERRGGANRMT